MPKYITQSDLEAALPPQTLVQLTDDDGDGVADSYVVSSIIEDAEAEVDGYLVGQYPTELGVDRLVKLSCKEIAMAFLFRRHPEYVRSYGERERADSLYKRALERLDRIQNAEQSLPDIVNEDGIRPKNVGGIVSAGGPRLFVSNPDGTSNSGDF